MYEKRLAPSGIVECVNHCVEKKSFVILEALKAAAAVEEILIPRLLVDCI